MFRGNEGRRKLQGIGGSKRVYAKKPRRRLTDDIARVDLVPANRQLLEPIEGKPGGPRIERRAAFKAGECPASLNS